MLTFDQSLLSYDDQSIIAELADKHQVTQKNTRLLLKYYTHFAKTLDVPLLTPSLRKTLAEIALIFTQKSNFYRTVQGRQCPGICFSINHILKRKSYSEINHLITFAKQVIDTVKFKDVTLKLQTLNLLTEIDKGLNEAILFEKLSWVFLKNTLENSAQTQSYKEKLINFAWCLYIDVKTNCFQCDSPLNTNKILMVSVLETIILNSLSHITPLILQKNSPKKYSMNIGQQKKEAMSSILQILLKQAEITSSQIIEYQEINEVFNCYFDELVSSGMVKSFSEQSFDFLCGASLQANFRKIDRKISKEIQSNEIDLRRLISYELAIEKDHKKTAIEDKLIVRHKKQQKCKQVNLEPLKKYKSHRVLNLDDCEVQMISSSIITESQINFPSNLVLDNGMRISAPGLHMRTEKDELRMFLIQKARHYMGDVNSYQPSIVSYIENAFSRVSERASLASVRGMNVSFTRNQNVFQAYEFYAYLAEQVWPLNRQTHPRYILEENDLTHECLLIIAIGTVLLLEWDALLENPYVKLLTCVRPGMMDFFYAVICVEEMDLPLKMANALKQTIGTLVNEFLWTDHATIEEINTVTQSISQFDRESCEQLPLTCIFQKVSSYMSQRVKSIQTNLSRAYSPYTCNQLGQWSKKSLQLAMAFTVYCPQVLEQRMLDQLVLCSMYGMSKFLKLSIRFHQIIQAYHEAVSQNPQQFQKTILNVKSSYSSQLNDIIGFYNSEFIGYLNYVFQIVGDQHKIDLVYDLCGDSAQKNDYLSPFRHYQQAIILSPKLNKNKPQSRNFKSVQRILNKENLQTNSDPSSDINLDHQALSAPIFYSFQQHQKPIASLPTQSKILINIQLNQLYSRNPTRVKERKLNEERENQLCATHKGKHPIFDQLRKIDEQ